jgi:hypothetical protein
MAKKKKDVLELFEEVFGKYPGSKLVEPLKDGACLQATVDGRDIKGEKRARAFVISEGMLDHPDISVEMNRAACEYMAASEELEDFVTRARECIERKHGNCYMTYEFNAGWTRLILKGYLDFARMLKIV